MKTTQWVKQEVDISYVQVILPVRYEEEDIPNDFPLRTGDVWKATIAIDNGQIQEWPKGVDGHIRNMKVCDEGVYKLLNHAGEEIVSLECDYVPNGLIPGQYGDYVTLQINSEGVITNWPKEPDVDRFFSKEFD